MRSIARCVTIFFTRCVSANSRLKAAAVGRRPRWSSSASAIRPRCTVKPRPKLVVATRNADKFREIQDKLSGLPIEILSLAEFPSLPATIEDQPDLLGNAIKKAREPFDATGFWTMADDTGLEVDALNGAPGVYTARFAGENATYADNCAKMLKEMSGVKDNLRGAQFKTVIALKTADGLYCVEGQLPGKIATAARGEKGFGYDPIFELADGRTLAEIELAEKNRLSHRGQAVEKLKGILGYLLPYSQAG